MKVWIKGNNKGRGFYYEYADGSQGWVYGLGAAELKREEQKHGKLVSYIPA